MIVISLPGLIAFTASTMLAAATIPSRYKSSRAGVLVGLAIAALIGRDDAEARRRKRRNLMTI
jgi:hypothetical protein